MDLHDTRHGPSGDPRPVGLGFGLSRLRHALLGTACRAGVVEHLFWRTLIRYRFGHVFGPGRAGGGTFVRAASRTSVSRGQPIVPHALRTPGELAPGLVTVIDKCGQALKGAWWMSWHREATKDVVACDKLREAGKRALIRRFLNEETHSG